MIWFIFKRERGGEGRGEREKRAGGNVKSGRELTIQWVWLVKGEMRERDINKVNKK